MWLPTLSLMLLLYPSDNGTFKFFLIWNIKRQFIPSILQFVYIWYLDSIFQAENMKTEVLSATWQLDYTEGWYRAIIFWDKSLLEIEEDICLYSWQRVHEVTNITDPGYILSFLVESLNLVYHDLTKQLSHYFILFFFSFLFLFELTTQKGV